MDQLKVILAADCSNRNEAVDHFDSQEKLHRLEPNFEVLLFPSDRKLCRYFKSCHQKSACEYEHDDNKSSLLRVLNYIREAREEILVCMYLFTSKVLFESIEQAHNRGVYVRIILQDSAKLESLSGDKSCALAELGIPTMLIGGIGKLMHHKFIVIDQLISMTGSFNWTSSAASRNHENLICITNSHVASEFVEEFSKLWSEARPVSLN